MRRQYWKILKDVKVPRPTIDASKKLLEYCEDAVDLITVLEEFADRVRNREITPTKAYLREWLRTAILNEILLSKSNGLTPDDFKSFYIR